MSVPVEDGAEVGAGTRRLGGDDTSTVCARPNLESGSSTYLPDWLVGGIVHARNVGGKGWKVGSS